MAILSVNNWMLPDKKSYSLSAFSFHTIMYVWNVKDPLTRLFTGQEYCASGDVRHLKYSSGVVKETLFNLHAQGASLKIFCAFRIKLLTFHSTIAERAGRSLWCHIHSQNVLHEFLSSYLPTSFDILDASTVLARSIFQIKKHQKMLPTLDRAISTPF